MTDSEQVAPHDDFSSHVERGARRFLRTAVVVDDRAALPDRDAVSLLDPPDYRDAAEAAKSTGKSDVVERETVGLDAKAVVEAFALEGVICAILRPEPGQIHGDQQSVPDPFLNSAARADLVVLDWILNNDDGEGALYLLRRIVAQDAGASNGRLRLIAIYTRERDLDGILEKVRDALEASIDDCCDPKNDDELWLESGGLRIVILAKEGTQTNPERAAAITPVNALPSTLIAHFSRMTDGLIPAFALHSLAVIRENAHHLLRKFAAELDVPFLSHRAYTTPHDAEDFAVTLMSLELRGLIQAAEVGQFVDSNVVESWIDKNVGNVAFSLMGKSLTRDEVLSLLRAGRTDETRPSSISKTQFGQLKSLTEMLSASPAAAEARDHALARLSSLSRSEGDHIEGLREPMLTLGTIVRVAESTSGPVQWRYLVSVQPVCDAVRLDDPARFAFLPMSVVQPSEKFDAVGFDPDGKRLYLRGSVGVRDLSLVAFTPDTDRRVRARRIENRLVFVSKVGVSYVWVAQLRDDQARRYATQLSGLFGRPGVDEYEWLRLSAGRH